VAHEASYISVQFDGIKEQKKFVYPSCFNSFLKLLDSDTAAEIEEKVNLLEQQEREQK
jgi:hypothetical protein